MKMAIVLLADTDSAESMGRMLNALMAAQECKDAGDDVQVIFDGAAVKWIGELNRPEHKYHDVYVRLRDKIAGVCEYCADAYGVTDTLHAADIGTLDDYQGHPSFRQLVADGYHVLTF